VSVVWYATLEEFERARKALPVPWRLWNAIVGGARLSAKVSLGRDAAARWGQRLAGAVVLLVTGAFLGGLTWNEPGLFQDVSGAAFVAGLVLSLTVGLLGLERAIKAGWFEWGLYVPEADP
jgi:hypothetical protein